MVNLVQLPESRKGHGPIDFISKGFGIAFGIALIRLSTDGVLISQSFAIILGIVWIIISIAAFFG
jgi:hypothetical protein